MTESDFVDVVNQSWWLLKPDLEQTDRTLAEKRKTLGECWDWTESWYTEELKLKEVYQFLQVNQQELLRDLDNAKELYTREQWLDNLIRAKRPPANKPIAEPAAPAPGKPADASGKPADATGKPADAPAAPPAKKASAFARVRTAEEPHAEEPHAEGAAPAGPSAAAPPAEPRKPSPFGRKAAAEEPAAQAPPAEPAQAAEVNAQIKAVISELSADELAAIAKDVGISADDVAAMIEDPEFARMVAEEQAHLGAEGGG